MSNRPPDDTRRSILDRIVLSFEWGSTALAVVGSLIILAITILVSINALSRKFAHQSIPGTIELVEYSLVWITFLAAAWILRRDGHVKVDVLYLVLPDSIVRWLWYIGFTCAGIATIFMCYYSIQTVYGEFLSGSRLIGQLIFPKWWITGIIPVGFLMMVFEFVIVLFKGPESMGVLGQEKLLDLSS